MWASRSLGPNESAKARVACMGIRRPGRAIQCVSKETGESGDGKSSEGATAVYATTFRGAEYMVWWVIQGHEAGVDQSAGCANPVKVLSQAV